MRPVPIVIAVGSNIDPESNVAEAVRQLRRHRGIDVHRVSECYRTEAVGGDYPDFVNAAVRGVTYLGVEELREELRGIETALGRVRSGDKNAPRTIDLDVVYYGDLVEDFGSWRVPDPDLLTEAHVAVPVAEVAPDWVHPERGVATKELALGIPDAEKKARPIMALHLSIPHGHRHGVDIDAVDGEVYAPRYEALVHAQLAELGEDPDREGLVRTPLRVAKAMDFLTSGYSTSLDEVVNGALFDSEGAEEMVLVKDIEFYSMCEHHMLPFFGKAAVAYLPKGKIIGLSKIARITDLFARRLQVQERMTNQIADALIEVLEPHGVAVVVEGAHFCMMMRGVQKQGSSMITSAMRGTFKDDARTRSEFLDLVRG
jgi:GTP cyclohydrolase IA